MFGTLDLWQDLDLLCTYCFEILSLLGEIFLITYMTAVKCVKVSILVTLVLVVVMSELLRPWLRFNP